MMRKTTRPRLAWAALAALAIGAGAGARGQHPPTPGGFATTIALDEPPYAFAVDVTAARAVVVGDPHRPDRTAVSVIDLRSGATIRARREPGQEVAIDHRTGRAFVFYRASEDQASADVFARTLDLTTGALLRTVKIHAAPSAVTVDEDTDRVFVDVGGGAEVLDARDGRLLPGIRCGAGARSMRAVDRRAGPVTIDVVARAITRSDGETLPFCDGLVVDARHRLLRTIPLSARDGVVEAPAGRVFQADAQDVDAADGNPHFPAQQGLVRLFDAWTGRELAVVKAGFGDGSLVVDWRTGHVFSANTGDDPAGVTGYTGPSVTMLDARTGRLLRVAPIAFAGAGPAGASAGKGDPGPGSGPGLSNFTVTLDQRDSRLFVANYYSDGVSVLDTRTGLLLTTWRVLAPLKVVVDERARRAFVLAGAATEHVAASDPWGWVPAPLRRALPFIPPPSPARTRMLPPRIVMVDEDNP